MVAEKPWAELSAGEMHFGAIVGVRRHVEQMNSSQRNKVGNPSFGWHNDIEAACAEMAYAKWSGQYWSGIRNTLKAPDVGKVQVRHTEHPRGNLIVQRNDPDEDLYVLLVGRAPRFQVWGAMRGAQAKQQGEWKDLNGSGWHAFVIDRNVLEPIGEDEEGV